MKVRFLTSIAGINFSHKCNDEVELLNKDEAKRYIQKGIAVEVVEKKAPKKGK